MSSHAEMRPRNVLAIAKPLCRQWMATMQDSMREWALQRGCDLVIAEEPRPAVERRPSAWTPK